MVFTPVIRSDCTQLIVSGWLLISTCVLLCYLLHTMFDYNRDRNNILKLSEFGSIGTMAVVICTVPHVPAAVVHSHMQHKHSVTGLSRRCTQGVYIQQEYYSNCAMYTALLEGKRPCNARPFCRTSLPHEPHEPSSKKGPGPKIFSSEL